MLSWCPSATLSRDRLKNIIGTDFAAGERGTKRKENKEIFVPSALSQFKPGPLFLDTQNTTRTNSTAESRVVFAVIALVILRHYLCGLGITSWAFLLCLIPPGHSIEQTNTISLAWILMSSATALLMPPSSPHRVSELLLISYCQLWTELVVSFMLTNRSRHELNQITLLTWSPSDRAPCVYFPFTSVATGSS